ncbi:unnamed protein product [Ectocarpus sp. 4 AP-2014]
MSGGRNKLIWAPLFGGVSAMHGVKCSDASTRHKSAEWVQCRQGSTLGRLEQVFVFCHLGYSSHAGITESAAAAVTTERERPLGQGDGG